jgi:hypothetical protein
VFDARVMVPIFGAPDGIHRPRKVATTKAAAAIAQSRGRAEAR